MLALNEAKFEAKDVILFSFSALKHGISRMIDTPVVFESCMLYRSIIMTNDECH